MEDKVIEFTPLRDFYDEDLRSQYLVGLNYTVHAGDKGLRLRAKVQQWLKEGKVALGTASGLARAEAKMKGVGKVS